MTDASRWTTARHEAGHAVAALHYSCPIAHVSIARQGHALGTTRMRLQRLEDAIVVFCGPLAEKNWEELSPGANVHFETDGTDQAALQELHLNNDECSACKEEALIFVSKREVQQQLDRVAQALLERTTMTEDEVRVVSGFSSRLCSPDWL